MINWDQLATQNGFASSKQMLSKWYFDEAKSASWIAAQLGLSPPSVLKEIEKRKIPKRKRGGANNIKDFSTGKEM